MLLAELSVCASAINLIEQHPRRIMAGTGFIPFHCISQNAAFIVRVE